GPLQRRRGSAPLLATATWPRRRAHPAFGTGHPRPARAAAAAALPGARPRPPPAPRRRSERRRRRRVAAPARHRTSPWISGSGPHHGRSRHHAPEEAVGGIAGALGRGRLGRHVAELAEE